MQKTEHVESRTVRTLEGPTEERTVCAFPVELGVLLYLSQVGLSDLSETLLERKQRLLKWKDWVTMCGLPYDYSKKFVNEELCIFSMCP